MSVDPYSYADTYYQDQEYSQELNDAYQKDLESLGTQDCYSGLVTIMTMTVGMIIMWYGLQEKMAADTMDALAGMQADVNTIESDYNNYIEGYGDGTQEEEEAYVNEAIDAYNDFCTIAAYDPAISESSIFEDLLTQMCTIMGGGDTETVENNWEPSAKAKSSTDPDSSTQLATDDVQPIEDAFSAVNTDLGNLSSTEQSTAQYYSSCQQQMEGMDETLMQGYATEEQTMISNQVVS
ncbi:MAG: hypothetical protein AB7S94_00135 [Simkaniaceae bacterium]